MEQKRKRIEVKAWRDAARGERCTMQIPGICNGNRDTTVAAHGNRELYGKGMSLKADDLFIAFACSACHDAFDKRTRTHFSNEFLDQCWQAGHARTLRKLYDLGLLGVPKEV